MAIEKSGPIEDIDAILSTVDDTTFNEDDWNVVIKECAGMSAKWDVIGGYLGLSISTIDSIKGAPSITNLDQCWHEALKNWIKQNYNIGKHALPSWRSLLAAVARQDRRLFKELAAAHRAVEPISVLCDREREMDAPEQSHQDTTYVFTSTPMTASSSGHSKYDLTFPCLDLKKMNKEEKQQLHQQLYAESVDMIDKFQNLFSATTKSLKQRKVSVEELLCNLAVLGPLQPPYKDLNYPVFRIHLQHVIKSKTIHGAMFEVGQYCSFFNFRMIEHIINKLGTRQDKKNLEKYREEFGKYAERHVFKCPAEVGTDSEDLAYMFVTLDKTFDDCTVCVLDLFVENLRKTLKISTGAIKLTRITPGSVKLTFQLSCSLIQDVFPLSRKQEEDLNGMSVANLWLVYQFNSTNVVYQFKSTNIVHGEATEAAGDLVTTTTKKLVKDNKDVAASAIGEASVDNGGYYIICFIFALYNVLVVICLLIFHINVNNRVIHYDNNTCPVDNFIGSQEPYLHSNNDTCPVDNFKGSQEPYLHNNNDTCPVDNFKGSQELYLHNNNDTHSVDNFKGSQELYPHNNNDTHSVENFKGSQELYPHNNNDTHSVDNLKPQFPIHLQGLDLYDNDTRLVDNFTGSQNLKKIPNPYLHNNHYSYSTHSVGNLGPQIHMNFTLYITFFS